MDWITQRVCVRERSLIKLFTFRINYSAAASMSTAQHKQKKSIKMFISSFCSFLSVCLCFGPTKQCVCYGSTNRRKRFQPDTLTEFNLDFRHFSLLSLFPVRAASVCATKLSFFPVVFRLRFNTLLHSHVTLVICQILIAQVTLNACLGLSHCHLLIDTKFSSSINVIVAGRFSIVRRSTPSTHANTIAKEFLTETVFTTQKMTNDVALEFGFTLIHWSCDVFIRTKKIFDSMVGILIFFLFLLVTNFILKHLLSLNEFTHKKNKRPYDLLAKD